MRLYWQLVRDSYAEMGKGEITLTNVLTKLLRLSQLTGGFLGSNESPATEQVSSAKLDVLEDLIDSTLEENRKLVIIARFVPELRAICSLLEKKGVRHSLIMGGVTNRDEQVAQRLHRARQLIVAHLQQPSQPTAISLDPVSIPA